MDIFSELSNLINSNPDDFILYIFQYGERCSIKYNFNEEKSGDNITFFTITPQATKENIRVQIYVLCILKKEKNKNIYDIAQPAIIDKTYITILTEIINTYKASVENNYFL